MIKQFVFLMGKYGKGVPTRHFTPPVTNKVQKNNTEFNNRSSDLKIKNAITML